MTDRIFALDRLVATVDTLMTRGNTATDPAQPFGVVRASSTTLPINPWKMRVSQSAGQSWLANTDTTLNFDDATTSPNLDSVGGFNAAAHTYTVPINGLYVVTVRYNVKSTAVSPISAFLELFQNGAYVSHTLGFWVTAGANQRLDMTLTDVVPFTTGDVLSCVINCNQASSVAVVGTAVCVWGMHLISG